MLLKVFSALSAGATALDIALKDRKLSPVKTAGFALMRFAEFYIGQILAYLVSMYALTELTVDLNEPEETPKPFWQWNFGEVAELVRWGSNIKIELTGEEKLPENGRYLVVSNHRSLFDPVTMAAAFRKQRYIYISKPSNFNIPVAGKLMHKCCCMQLNRENNRDALTTIKRSEEFIKNDVASVVIYPEGTRSKEDELLPFHAGSFKIAQKTGAPVVLIAMRNTDDVRHNMPFKRTTVHIDIVDVIDGEFVRSHTTKETAELARNIIQKKLDTERGR